MAAGVGLILSLGPVYILSGGENETLIPLPYWLIYKFIPGAQGLRVPARLVVVAIFSGSLLAGLGLDFARRYNDVSKRTWQAVLLIALAFVEGMAHYQLMTKIPTGDQVPEVYQDIAEMVDDTVLLELPTHRYKFQPMYFSTYHLHHIANGRSAFIPPPTLKLDRLTDPEWPYAFGPALLDHLQQIGVNTILVKRAKFGNSERKMMLKRLNRLHCLDPIKQYPNRDILFRLTGTRGGRGDVKPTPLRRFEHAMRPSIELPGENAYPVNARRPMRFSASDGSLSVLEPNHFRWLVKIPTGYWHLKMVVRSTDHPKISGGPITLRVKIADFLIHALTIKKEEVEIASRPFLVSKSAYFTVDCTVLHEPTYASIQLELEDIRLEALEEQNRND